ncbi:hypothetical protein [Deinococcus ruber]|uniref:hypothetical protein n=1 Tax=Deinococcus ruber TaxID=1848197 RepID=UPI001665FBCB|nr:hypothetical protein [Deinococcus ruber]
MTTSVVLTAVLFGVAVVAMALIPPDRSSLLFVKFLVALIPLVHGSLLYRAYLQIDEYGQNIHERAAMFAFRLTMLTAIVLSIVLSNSHINTSLSGIYMFGMLMYSLGLLWQGRDRR